MKPPAPAPRQHRNADGSPKHAFESRAAAVAARKTMAASHVKVYRCPECRSWHHGHNPERRR